METGATIPPDSALNTEKQVLLDALGNVLAPLARLCVGKGVTIQMIEERLRLAFVQAARMAHADQPSSRLTSRISATTGLTRREVARLENQPAKEREMHRSPVTELFTRWLADPALRTPAGKPLALPRQGPAPSFEALAQSVTRDVHPRTLLDELGRLRLAEHDSASDTVQILSEAFVPRGDWARMMAYLGDNVGDHLRAATANVLGDGTQHFEQAIFADELSDESLAQARELMTQHWRHMLDEIAPRLEKLIAADRHAGRPQDQCMRIGLFTWSQPMPPAPQAEQPPTPQGETP
ncbi:MAG: DUF6502 family protein [Burkholderiaceae bacterium]